MVRQEAADDGMATLVIRGQLGFTPRHDPTPALWSGAHAIDSFLELGHGDGCFVASGGKNRRFVEDIGEVGSGKSRRLPGQCLKRDVWLQRFATRMHVENRLSTAYVWRGNNDHSIETTRPQQGRVEDIRPIGRRDDNHASMVFKSVHFHQDLIERLLAFVIGVAQSRSALATNRVNFVDEDDARCTVAGFAEQIAYTTGADADEHLDEF